MCDIITLICTIKALCIDSLWQFKGICVLSTVAVSQLLLWPPRLTIEEALAVLKGLEFFILTLTV